MIEIIISSILPSLTVGILLAIFNRKQQKQMQHKEQIEKEKLESEVLELNLVVATAQLSYAVAMALKRGEPNGEIEEGIEAYEKAMEDFRKFERKQIVKGWNL